MTMPTVADLQRVFESSGLERKGWTFERAMQDATLSWSLKHQAEVRAKRNARSNDANGGTNGGHVAKNWNGTVPKKTEATMCRAVQYSDQMCCGKCGTSWDVNDPEPPKCKNALGSSRVEDLK